MAQGPARGRPRLRSRTNSLAAHAVWVLVCAGASGSATAEPPEEGVSAAPKPDPTSAIGPHRLVRLFDFDEANNPDPVPPGWERTTLTPDGKPRHGFPRFNLAKLDDRMASSGTRCVRLPTAGGSTALRLRGGEAAVFADADYAVSARVRTQGLEHARAFITVRLLDQRLQVIPGSEMRSEPIASEGGWRTASVQVPGGKAGAAWIQIDLELLQPEQVLPPARDDPASQALAKHRMFREDVRGSAWFDDVAVAQIPRATITTLSPCNIVHGNERPTLQTTVRDLGGEALRARVQVFDLRARRIDESVEPINPDGRPLVFTPRLPGYGWYAARLDVLGEAGGPDASPVSSAEVSFIWLPSSTESAFAAVPNTGPDGPDAGVRARAAALVESDHARFGLLAERTPDARIGDLPALVSRLDTRFLYLPIWQPETTLASTPTSLAERRPTIEALLRQGQSLTFALDGVPNELSRATLAPADDSLSLSTVPQAQWMPYLTPTLDIFGQRVVRYQLGRSGGDHAFWKTDLSRGIELMESGLATLVPGPVISVPWTADRALPSVSRPMTANTDAATPAPGSTPSSLADVRGTPGAEARRTLATPLLASSQNGPLVDGLTVWYPSAFPASEIGPVLRALHAPDAPNRELTLVFDLPPAPTYGAPAAITELMRRAIELWATQGQPAAADSPASKTPDDDSHLRLALDQPWSWSNETAPQVLPLPELASFTVLRDRLSGRRIVGQLTNVTGVKCYILAARNTALGTLEHAALVAWNESADRDHAIVDAAAVGGSVTVVDAFGNQTAIPVPGAGSESSGGSAASPLVTVPVGETPVFIEGIDPYLALFAASFRLEPSFMPAVVREHEHRIILTNPWPVRITGKLQLKEDTDRNDRSRPARTLTDEWRVAPSGIIDFDMAPGQTSSIPVTLSFGPAQLAGIKDFVIVARAMADRAYPPIRMRAAVEVGLEDIEMNPELQVTPGNDVVVVAAVTNKGTRPRTLRLESAARNMPSQQLQISELPPGQTVLRRFIFKDAARELSGRRVVISLSDLEEAQRLNKAVAVP